MQRAENLDSTMSQGALANLEKNVIKNMNNLKDEVLNLIDIVINLPKENQKLRIKC